MGQRSDAPSTLTPDSEVGATAVALPPELARLPGLMGVESLRAFRADRHSLACLTACRVSAAGDLTELPRVGLLDSVLPGGTALLQQLDPNPLKAPLVLRNSPRRWVVAWAESAQRAVLLAVHAGEGQDLQADRHGELLRVLASAALRVAEDRQAAAGEANAPAWPLVDRRARGRPSLLTWVGLGGAVLALLLAAWLALVSLPDAERQAQAQQQAVKQGRELAERTLSRSLSNAVLTGDYGEVQAMLSFYASLGYFESAAVLNARGKVVAMVGAPGSLQMGAEPGPAATGLFDSVNLGSGDTRSQLLRPAAPAVEPAANTIHLARLLAGLASLAAAAALVVLGRPVLKRRPPPDQRTV